MLHNVERSSKYEEPRCSECILYPVCVGMFAAQFKWLLCLYALAVGNSVKTGGESGQGSVIRTA